MESEANLIRFPWKFKAVDFTCFHVDICMHGGQAGFSGCGGLAVFCLLRVRCPYAQLSNSPVDCRQLWQHSPVERQCQAQMATTHVILR